MKKAILCIADVGALESTAYMLECAGYECSRPDPKLLHAIRWEAKCEGIYSVEELVKDWGYAEPMVHRLASLEDMKTADLYVDVKGHINHDKIVSHWPNLKGKVLWCCLNGGDPTKRKEYYWANPPCPVLTNNQWYRQQYIPHCEDNWGATEVAVSTPIVYERAYACYPPYMRMHHRQRVQTVNIEGPPICLVHNVRNWGYGHLVDALSKELGVKFYGINDCPDGMIRHEEAMKLLSEATCMVHLKNGDTVGYAMVEAMATGTPFVCTQQYIDDTRLHELLEPGVTCLTFNPANAVQSLRAILNGLKGFALNHRIGSEGNNRLKLVQWNSARDLEPFKEFMNRNFAQGGTE